MSMTTRGARLFKVMIIAGFGLGFLLLAETYLTYQYVTGHLVMDHLSGEASRYVSLLEQRARMNPPRDNENLGEMLDEIRLDPTANVAWIRVADPDGQILAESGESDDQPLTNETIDSLMELRSQSLVDTRAAAQGDVLVVTLPCRFRFADEGPRQRGETPTFAGPRFKMAEVALSIRESAGVYAPLQRNLMVGTVASLALLASMVMATVLFPRYLRGKQLDDQLAVARLVQEQLLPVECDKCQQLDFSAHCLPAWDVGGDYYDVFALSRGRFALVLGDVSGKGLSAALLMGLLNGAVRTAAGMWDEEDHAELIRRLGELLYAQTSPARFVSLFWACYDPADSKLRYVNAGHLPALLLRRDANDAIETHRLRSGGPVLGILPGATYKQEDLTLQPGDLLVIYSDGLVEAMDAEDNEFGEERLVLAAEECGLASTREVQERILERVRAFVGKQPLHDDLTLLVARFGDSSPETTD